MIILFLTYTAFTIYAATNALVTSYEHSDFEIPGHNTDELPRNDKLVENLLNRVDNTRNDNEPSPEDNENVGDERKPAEDETVRHRI